MSKPIVLDSGIYLASLLPDEPMVRPAKELLGSLKRLSLLASAPVLLRYEMVATVRKNVFRGRISADIGMAILSSVFKRQIKLYFSANLAQRAYELAGNHNLPTAYDAQYLAVAEYLGCEFWTADEKLVNSVSAQLPWVKWVGGGLPL